jgi:hypothetical protein
MPAATGAPDAAAPGERAPQVQLHALLPWAQPTRQRGENVPMTDFSMSASDVQCGLAAPWADLDELCPFARPRPYHPSWLQKVRLLRRVYRPQL